MEQLFCGKLHRQWRQVAPHPALRATFTRRGRLFEKRYIMSKLHLILPMAGRGSRFFKNGFVCPKPLIEINGKPFFYWAARSVDGSCFSAGWTPPLRCTLPLYVR